ncbi:hypothetical protein HZS_5839 [Henneguya salminicola]|nr:hypothetical protein HZS_5839 [Henneguya salminicola]
MVHTLKNYKTVIYDLLCIKKSCRCPTNGLESVLGPLVVLSSRGVFYWRWPMGSTRDDSIVFFLKINVLFTYFFNN